MREEILDRAKHRLAEWAKWIPVWKRRVGEDVVRCGNDLKDQYRHVSGYVRAHALQTGVVLACLAVASVSCGASICLNVNTATFLEGMSMEDPLVEQRSTVAQSVLKNGTVEEMTVEIIEEGGGSVAEAIDLSASEVLADLFITSDALLNITSASDLPQAFSLFSNGRSEQEAVLIDDASSGETNDLSDLTEAIKAIEDQGYDVGCFFLNLNTGEGIAYDLDTRIYGASSFKGVYASYLSEHLADGESGLSSSARSLMDASILYSDNSAFSSLRDQYDSSGFTAWLEDCGVSSDIAYDTHFPRYSARESALLWLHTYHYLESGTQAACHLADIYSRTNVSFIREGVEEVADDEVTVMNKAGWIASSSRFSGLCDAGLIECGGDTYLMSVMCSTPDSETHRDQVVDIVEALFELR